MCIIIKFQFISRLGHQAKNAANCKSNDFKESNTLLKDFYYKSKTELRSANLRIL